MHGTLLEMRTPSSGMSECRKNTAGKELLHGKVNKEGDLEH